MAMKKNYLSGTGLITKYVLSVFPKVNKELLKWAEICKFAEDELLAKQAQSSINLKKFHAQGGSIYALYPNVDTTNAVKFIVAFQTISDYLDNLCDRAGVMDEASFRQLHLSMTDAVDIESNIRDYYMLYPHRNDNNYLKELVLECRKQISKLPSYHLVINPIKKYIELYSDLQSLKHLSEGLREQFLSDWAEKYSYQYGDISKWEFCASTGSTLGIFVLFASAFNKDLTKDEVKSIESAYFPWICGLHILLDYFIDLAEDLQMNDLNFTCYYENIKMCEERLSFFIQHSFESCLSLPCPLFHITVVKGLLAMYLSDQKAFLGLNRLASKNLTRSGGQRTVFYHNICRLLRLAGAL